MPIYAIFAVDRDGSWKDARRFSSEAHTVYIVKITLYTILVKSTKDRSLLGEPRVVGTYVCHMEDAVINMIFTLLRQGLGDDDLKGCCLEIRRCALSSSTCQLLAWGTDVWGVLCLLPGTDSFATVPTPPTSGLATLL